jgi:selenocysteine-specific elongation factor
VKGTGTVVTGSVWSGTLSTGRDLRVLPSGKLARVRRLHRHGVEVESVNPGERAAIALAGVDVDDVPRGSVLVTSAEWEPAGILDAWISLSMDTEIALRSGAIVRFQLGGAEVGATLAAASSSLKSGYSGFARIKLETPIAARGGDRFVLRLPAPIGTIGGGVILDLNSAAPFTRAQHRFDAATVGSEEHRLRAILELSGDAGVASGILPIRLGCAPGQVDDLLSRAGALGGGGFAFDSGEARRISGELLNALEENERTFPLASGVQLESLKGSLQCRGELVDAVLNRLKSDGQVAVEGPLVRRASWKPVLSGEASKTIDSIVHAICAGGKEPPSVGELEEKLGGDVVGLLHYLEREGRVVEVDSARYYAPGTVAELVAKLRAGLQEGVEYDPSQLRVVLGFSRKYLIPFLEYCDRAGITERGAGGRRLRATR